jgi:hypothetical protein
MKRMTALARRLKPSRRGPSWLQLCLAMALTLTLAVVSPALGGPSLRSIVRSEVARQIDNLDVATVAKKKGKRGPAGPQGPQGAPGAKGADGTARAYGLVYGEGAHTCTPSCLVVLSKGIGTVTRIGTGDYCAQVPGVDANAVSAAADVSWGGTTDPEGNASAMTYAACDGTGFEVRTERINPATGSSAASDTVSFTIVVP